MSNNLHQFSIERMAIVRFLLRAEDFGVWNMSKGEDVVYRNAIIEKLKTDTKFLETFMDGNKDVLFRNHQRDKKGKLVKVDVTFE